MLNYYIFDKNKEIVENIPAYILEYSSKYKEKTAKENSTFSWYMLDKILKEKYDIDLSKEEIYLNEFKKPYIKNKSIYFSISHSSSLSLIAISDNEVGADIEELINYDNLDKLASKILSTKELNEYYIALDKQSFLTRKWTIKEAYYKMKSTGISFLKLHNDIDDESINSFFVSDSLNKKYFVSIVNKNKEKVDN